MTVKYKIYKLNIIPVDPEVVHQGYSAPKYIYPTILREIYQEGWDSQDTFDTLVEAERYLQENLIKEYGSTYTILKEYS